MSPVLLGPATVTGLPNTVPHPRLCQATRGSPAPCSPCTLPTLRGGHAAHSAWGTLPSPPHSPSVLDALRAKLAPARAMSGEAKPAPVWRLPLPRRPWLSKTASEASSP